MRVAAQKFVGEHDFRNFCRVSIEICTANFHFMNWLKGKVTGVDKDYYVYVISDGY